MKEFFLRNNLAIITALGVLVLSWTLVFWQQMPVTQRCVGLFIAGIVVHLWEEGRIPGHEPIPNGRFALAPYPSNCESYSLA